MREADLGAVYGSITSGFYDGEYVMISRVEDEALNGRLGGGGC